MVKQFECICMHLNEAPLNFSATFEGNIYKYDKQLSFKKIKTSSIDISVHAGSQHGKWAKNQPYAQPTPETNTGTL